LNRRDSIKRLALASGALIALPAWAKEWSAEDLVITGNIFNATEHAVLTAATDTIIPGGNAIGAVTVGVDKFLQRLFSDCYEKEVQDNIKVQLTQLDKNSQLAFGKTFAEASQAQREELLLKLSASDTKEEKDFFNLLKSETIRGFNTSREVLMGYLNFKPVPGHYHGCVDVKN
jgi:hypothetical protein